MGLQEPIVYDSTNQCQAVVVVVIKLNRSSTTTDRQERRKRLGKPEWIDGH